MKKMRTSPSRHDVPVVPEPAPPVAAPPALEATADPATMSSARPVAPAIAPRATQHRPAPVRRPTHLRTVTLASATFLVVAALALASHPSAPGTNDDAAGSQPEAQEPTADLPPSLQPVALPEAPIAAPVAASATVAPRAVTAPSKNTLTSKPETNRVAESTNSAAPMEEVATKPPESVAATAPEPAGVSTGTGGAAPVTITGCLEISVNQDEFRLTDTEGADAPKSRSWRTGFLKKRSSPVALIEPRDGLALQTHVGRRVAATGLLTSHDLKVSALRVVGPTCN